MVFYFYSFFSFISILKGMWSLSSKYSYILNAVSIVDYLICFLIKKLFFHSLFANIQFTKPKILNFVFFLISNRYEFASVFFFVFLISVRNIGILLNIFTNDIVYSILLMLFTLSK